MSVEDQTTNGKDQMAVVSRDKGLDLPGRLWAQDDFTAAEALPVDFGTGLVSLAFIRAAIRRRASFWCAIALAGLLAGFGIYLAFPPAYQASTSVLLTYGPYENVNTAPQDDAAIAQSRAVAGLAVHQLGLRESVSSFLAAYSVTAASNRVLLITVNAPSSHDAVSRANAVATAFLRFRAGQLETDQNLVVASLDQQINQVKQEITAIGNQISQLSARTASPTQKSALSGLQAERSQSASVLTTLEQTAKASPATTATALAVKGSVVLDAAAPMPHSLLKPPLFDATVGLVVGLALGLGIVIVQALGSDRLRRRDDVAHALGAPVRLSVGPLRLSVDTLRLIRWLRGKGRLETACGADVQRIAAFLGSAVPAGRLGAAALAVVPVDDHRAAALSLVSLAVSRAQEGRQVVVADLCPEAPAAMLLDTRKPGVRVVHARGAQLVVAVPDRGDVLPAGPLECTPPRARRSPLTEEARSPLTKEVAAACASADLLLTLATLDPSLGGEHLTTWATAAVAVVTAGKSSSTRIHAIGEMIRLAGMRLDSAVLIGADRTDESLGELHDSGHEYQPDRV